MVLDPKNINVHNALGRYYIKVGKVSRARQEFEQVLRVDKNNALAKQQLAKIGR